MTYRPAKPSVLVPQEYQAEIEMLTKYELVDLVWDYARQIALVENQGRFFDSAEKARAEYDRLAFNEFRQRRDNVLQRRRKAQQGSK